MSGWIYRGTLPIIEDSSRYSAPPEEREERDLEPEDFADFYDEEPTEYNSNEH